MEFLFSSKILNNQKMKKFIIAHVQVSIIFYICA